MKQRIIAVHLLNDRSGSPLVLRQALEALQPDYDISVYTATPGGDGFLSNMPGTSHHSIFYRWHTNKLVTLFYFILSQLLLCIRLINVLKKTDIVYINTLLPFGAALAGRIKGCRIIYHVHETSLRPLLLKHFLFTLADHTARQVLFVSHYVAGHYSFKRPATQVIHNTLPGTFINETRHIPRLNLKRPFTVTMLCSLKGYKGVHHFINIARQMPGLRFELILNAPEKATRHFIKQVVPPENCTVYPAQKNTVDYYERAHVIMNLSKPDGWVETFGMTLLEAMHCGRPVICPPVGGVLELVDNGIEGFAIDSSREGEISAMLGRLSLDFTRYKAMSEAAYKRSMQFDREKFDQDLREAFHPAANSVFGNKHSSVFRNMEIVGR